MAGADWLALGSIPFLLSELQGFAAGLVVMDGFFVGNASPGGSAQALAGILLNQMEGTVTPAGFDAVGLRPKLWGPKRCIIPMVTKYVAPEEELAEGASVAAGAEAFRARYGKPDARRSLRAWSTLPPAALIVERMRRRNVARRGEAGAAPPLDFEGLRKDGAKIRKAAKEAAREATKAKEKAAKAKPAP